MLLFGIEIPDKHDIVGKIVDSLKQPEVKISIWTVNGSQNKVLVIEKRSVNVNYQGIVIGYDIEIYVMVFFVCNWTESYEEGSSTSGTS